MRALMTQRRRRLTGRGEEWRRSTSRRSQVRGRGRPQLPQAGITLERGARNTGRETPHWGAHRGPLAELSFGLVGVPRPLLASNHIPMLYWRLRPGEIP